MKNKVRKKILFIATGGTFSAVHTDEGLKPFFDPEQLIAMFPESSKLADISGVQLCHLDSTNVHPKDWTKMAEFLGAHYDEADGFIIGHGTDTLAQTAAALSYAVQGSRKPIVLTGSVLSTDSPNSDARQNFLDSVVVAVDGTVKDVCICFHGNILKGTHARKITNEATKFTNEELKVYSTVNVPTIGSVKNAFVLKNAAYRECKSTTKSGRLEIFAKFDPRVGLIKLFPGIESRILNFYKDTRAIVIEAFGPGNIPFTYSNWLEDIQRTVAANIPVFVTTQVPFGEVDMNLYEVGFKAKQAGAISCEDMTIESVTAKLMWILGNFPDISGTQIAAKFNEDVAGEFYGRTDGRVPNG
ncbi:MAG: asparaginase [Bdellovibrionales bacterium]